MKIAIPIGIDLGTSTSEITAFFNGAHTTLEDDNNRKVIPSVIAYNPASRRVVVGDDAESDLAPIREAKRKMHDDAYVLQSNGRDFSPPEVGAEVLKYLIGMAQNNFSSQNYEIGNIIVTIPAAFPNLARVNTMKACTLAGFNNPQLIQEPCAAAVYYSYEFHSEWNKQGSFYFLVFDFGGGTLDLTIGYKDGVFLDMKYPKGDREFGGKDVDEALMNYAKDNFKKKSPNAIINKNVTMDDLFKKAAEKCKIALTRKDSGSIYVPGYANQDGETIDIVEEIDRNLFDNVIMAPLLKRIEELLDKLFNSNKVRSDCIDKDSIKYVLFVGGSSKIPCVQKKVLDYFGISENDKDVRWFIKDPNLAVSRGAAIWAANKMVLSLRDEMTNPSNDTPENIITKRRLISAIGLDPTKTQDIVMRTPYGYGGMVCDPEKDGPDGPIYYQEMIQPGSALPSSKTFNNRLLSPDQTSLFVSLFQTQSDNAGGKIIFEKYNNEERFFEEYSNSNKRKFNNRYIVTDGIECTGVIGEINDIKPSTDGKRPVLITINMDDSGIINVTYEIPSTGQKTTLKYSGEVVQSSKSKQ